MQSLFGIPDAPYYLFAPAYLPDSSGVRVMHYLCHALNAMGQEAYVTTTVVSPRLRTPYLTPDIFEAHRRAGRQPVVVYPEVVPGNPFKAPVVVRYLLNVPGYFTGESRYGDDDLYFTQTHDLLLPGMSAELLTCPMVDTGVFHPPVEGAVRSGAAFYADSYMRDKLPLTGIPAGAIEISPNVPRRTHAELAELFRSVEVLYSFEPSALTIEARLCGCPVVYMPNPEHLAKPLTHPVDHLGTSWGDTSPAGIARARAELPQLAEVFQEIEERFWEELNHFVAITQRRAREVPQNPALIYTSTVPPEFAEAGTIFADDKKGVEFSFVVCSINPDRLAKLKTNIQTLLAGYHWELIHIGDARSLCEGYNRGFARARGRYVVFCHDDIEILNPDFGACLLRAFETLDVVGVVGTTLVTGPAWAHSPPKHWRGQVAHPVQGGWVVDAFGVYDKVQGGLQALDGLFFAMRREVAEAIRFDEETFDGFHLYDIDFTFTAYRAGYRLGVSSEILVIHESTGGFGADWSSFAARFRLKHAGHYLPHEMMTKGSSLSECKTRDLLLPAFRRNLAQIAKQQERIKRLDDYAIWRDKTSLQEVDAEVMAERMMTRWPSHPVFVVVMVVGAADLPRLADTLDSLQSQFYRHWRLIVVSDQPCPDPVFQSTDILGWLQIDSVTDLAALTVACNELLSVVTGDWFVRLPAGTRLAPECLLMIGDYAALHPDWQAIYPDHDEATPCGSDALPRFKPDFNLDLLRSCDYVGPTVFLKWETLARLGGWLPYAGVEHCDVIFRLLEQRGMAAIGHVDRPVLHLPFRPIGDAETRPLSAVVAAHLERLQPGAEVRLGRTPGILRVVHPLSATPKVSLVMAVQNGYGWVRPAIESLFAKTDYPDFELVVVDHESSDPELLHYFGECEARYAGRFQRLSVSGTFNLAGLNNLGAQQSSGDLLLFLHSDIQVVQAEWLSNLVRHALRSEIGVVGARLEAPQAEGLRHGGMVLGLGLAGAAPVQIYSFDCLGDMLRTECDQNYSAVSGAAFLVKRALFDTLQGFDEQLDVTLSDVDFCLRASNQGLFIVWTPSSVLVHLEKQTISAHRHDPSWMSWIREREQANIIEFYRRWGGVIARDPAYNRNLSLQMDRVFRIEREYVTEWDTAFHDRPRILAMQPSGGVGEYRFHRPLRALMLAGRAQIALCQTEGYNAVRYLGLSELERLSPDSLMCQAWPVNTEIEWHQRYRDIRPDIRQVFMMDDLMTRLPEQHPNYRDIARDVRFHLRRLLATGDSLVVTTEPLIELARDMIGEIHLVPNCLATDRWGHLQSLRRQGKKLRVGWAGAQQHQGDLALIRQVVMATAEVVDWVFMGMRPAGLAPYVREFHEFEVNVEAYPQKLASLNLDLALAPLEIHPFNEAKSNLRLLEYGAMGWPVICTDILPYQTNQPPVVRLPNQPQRWIDAILERAAEPDALAADGDRLRDWVWQNYRLEDRLDDWMLAVLGRCK